MINFFFNLSSWHASWVHKVERFGCVRIMLTCYSLLDPWFDSIFLLTFLFSCEKNWLIFSVILNIFHNFRHGCDTIIASRKLDVLKNAAEKLSKATGQRCMPIQMDVRKVLFFFSSWNYGFNIIALNYTVLKVAQGVCLNNFLWTQVLKHNKYVEIKQHFYINVW